MYKNVEALRADLKQYIFKRDPEKTLEAKAQAIMENLRQQDKFKNFSDDELYSYALGQIGLSFANRVNTVLENSFSVLGKPSDPIWSQFTYDEILDMADDGVNVPQEFLDWANSMAAADTTSYELDTTSSTDSCTEENMNSQSDDTTLLGRQKKLQKYSSKAKAQEELLQEKNMELQAQNADINSLQNDLELNQQMIMRRIDNYSKEFELLNSRFQSGDSLTDDEIRRYKELGLILNVESQELWAQSGSVSDELENLMNEMSDADNLVDINFNIARTLDSLGVQYADEEGSKNFGSLSQTSGLFVSGDLELYAYAAQSQSLTATATTLSSDLNINSMDLQFKINMNASVADVTMQNINNIQNNNDIIYRAEPVNQENTDENNVEDLPQPEQTTSEQPAETQTTPPAQGETVPPAETQTAPSAQGETVPPAETQTTPPAQGETVLLTETQTATPEQFVSNSVAESQTMVNDVASGVQDNTNVLTGNENIIGTITQETLNIPTAETTDTQVLNSEVNTAANQVSADRNIALNDENLFRSRYNARIKEYRDLLSKVRSQNSVEAADIQSSQLINSEIEAQTADFSVSMQSYINNLNNVSSNYADVPQTVSENIQSGTNTISAGQDYTGVEQNLLAANTDNGAPSQFNQQATGQISVNPRINTVENVSTVESQAVLRNSVVDSAETFSGEGATVLRNTLSSVNLEVNNLNQQFEQALQENDLQSGTEQNTGMNNTLTVTDNSDNENVDESDAADLESTASQADIQAQDAKTQANQAVKDKKAADADLKRNVNLLNNNERQITTLSRNVSQNSELLNNINTQIQSYSEGNQSEPSANPEGSATVTRFNTVQNASDAPQAPASDINTGDDATQQETNIAQLGAIVSESQQIGQRVTSDGTTINVLENQSNSSYNQVNNLYTTKSEQADEDQKQALADAKDTQDSIETVTTIGNAFTTTKISGLGLMSIPWTYSAGVVMYNVGRYGELASYATNSALNLANGNLLGAAANIGAAALSFANVTYSNTTSMQSVRAAGAIGAQSVAEIFDRSSSAEVAATAGQETVDQAVSTAADIENQTGDGNSTPREPGNGVSPEQAITPETDLTSGNNTQADTVNEQQPAETTITGGQSSEITANWTPESDITASNARQATNNVNEVGLQTNNLNDITNAENSPEVTNIQEEDVSTDADMQDEVNNNNETRIVNSTAKETIADFTASDIADDVISEISSDISSDIADEVNNQTVNTVSSEAASEIIPSSVTPSPVSISSLISDASVSEFEAAAATNMSSVSQEISMQEATKTLSDDNAEFWLRNAALDVAKSTMLTQGDRLQQKDTKDETRRKVLVRFEQKKRDEIKKGIEAVNKSARMKH